VLQLASLSVPLRENRRADEAVQALLISIKCSAPVYILPDAPWGIAVSGTHRFRENAHCRTAAEILFGDSRAVIKVDARIPALPRNCEIDWFAAGYLGTVKRTAITQERGRKPPRSHETEFSVVRRD